MRSIHLPVDFILKLVERAKMTPAGNDAIETRTNVVRHAHVLANSGRLAGLDALRGVMLTIVLADHCGGVLNQASFIRQWTLMGLGWSDAAEGFVFLSGVTFGWVYSARLERHGPRQTLRLGLLRTLQIYLAYLLTVLGVALLGQLQLGNVSSSGVPIDARLLDALLLIHQPYAVGILCMYIVCLPTTLLLFVGLVRNRAWLMFLISYGCYSLVQIFPGLNLPADHGGWFFNPFAWQLLMNVGALLGHSARQAQTAVGNSAPDLSTNAPRSGAYATTVRVVVLLAAASVVLISLFSQKGEWLVGMPVKQQFLDTIYFSQWQHEWLDKTSLGPLRYLHFAALTCLLLWLVPLRSACWSRWWLAPFRICGRHSLEVYCVGVLLTHALRLLPNRWSDTSFTAALLVLVVLTVQFVIAALLDGALRSIRIRI